MKPASVFLLFQLLSSTLLEGEGKGESTDFTTQFAGEVVEVAMVRRSFAERGSIDSYSVARIRELPEPILSVGIDARWQITVRVKDVVSDDIFAFEGKNVRFFVSSPTRVFGSYKKEALEGGAYKVDGDELIFELSSSSTNGENFKFLLLRTGVLNRWK